MKSLILIFISIIGVRADSLSQVKITPSDPEQILKVTFKVTGSEMGGKLDFTISKDSISYYYSGTFNSNDQYMDNGKSDKAKTDILYWNRLINSINLSDFDKAPQGKPTASLDGIDEMLVITTSKSIHSVIIIPDSREKYKSIKTFIDILSRKLKEYKIEMFY